jgi:hypothetical protein
MTVNSNKNVVPLLEFMSRSNVEKFPMLIYSLIQCFIGKMQYIIKGNKAC